MWCCLLWVKEASISCGHGLLLVDKLLLVDHLRVKLLLGVLMHPASHGSLMAHNVDRDLLLLRHLKLLGPLLFHVTWDGLCALGSHLSSSTSSFNLRILLHPVHLILDLLTLEVILCDSTACVVLATTRVFANLVRLSERLRVFVLLRRTIALTVGNRGIVLISVVRFHVHVDADNLVAILHHAHVILVVVMVLLRVVLLVIVRHLIARHVLHQLLFRLLYHLLCLFVLAAFCLLYCPF